MFHLVSYPPYHYVSICKHDFRASEDENVVSVKGALSANGCVVQGVVAVTAKNDETRQSARVTARNVNTDAVVHTEVFVARVHSLAIETRSRTMYRDDIERLDVVARDIEGMVAPQAACSHIWHARQSLFYCARASFSVGA